MISETMKINPNTSAYQRVKRARMDLNFNLFINFIPGAPEGVNILPGKLPVDFFS